ncbi:MAG: tetraacyldisaccharide 4'-kinase [Methylophilaceae bacterium]|nr:tetraacyldisaccharide 4'-kinase [Methylophilaceae bacterium]
MSLHEKFNQQFYVRPTWIKLLIPLSYLYLIIIYIRKFLYSSGLLDIKKVSVPVIIIGNITVGGTGKTPLLIAIASHFLSIGINPGIISRGYKSSNTHAREVTDHSNFLDVGDEPFMLKRNLGIPVFVGKKRFPTAELLLTHYPDIDVILSDDGLQHTELARDYEIVVVDKARGFGNNHLLPSGPLREPIKRLNSIDAMIINGEKSTSKNAFSMHYSAIDQIQSVFENKYLKINSIKNKQLYAYTGIGNPERFFSLLKNFGLTFDRLIFDDHHNFSDEDFRKCGNKIIIMTEKDAVRCLHLKNKNIWYLPIKAMVDTRLFVDIRNKIGL